MRNNIMIIVVVTIVALGVITTVILASVLNNSEKRPPDTSSGSDHSSNTDYSYSESEPAYSSNETNVSVPDNSSGGDIADSIVETAYSLIGVPFVENGDTPEGFDNSGFIYYVLRENGFITCPRETSAQSQMGTRHNSLSELKKGDLVFFYNDDPNSAGFGGIYLGRGKMISCLMPGTEVREVDITTNYYGMRFFCGISIT